MTNTSTIVDSAVRSDLVEAHRAVIEDLGTPGSWWNGEERLAIAAEVRRAIAHRDLPPWQSPSAAGLIISGVLPDAAVDAIWRITNHPGTLTQTWVTDIVTQLPSALHYVELVGLVAALNAVERFALSLDLELLPLPAARPGSVSAVEPDTSISTHWVPTASVEGPMVLKALSAVPLVNEMMRSLAEAQYVPADALLGDLAWTRGTLTRQQIELVAAQTSLNNECFY